MIDLGDEEVQEAWRGAALGTALNPLDPRDPLREYLTAEWFMVGDREYPPWYYHSLGAYRANPEDIERVRDALAGVPRLPVEEIDILFNGMTRCWDIVRWYREPGGQVHVPGLGWVTTVISMPADIYTILPEGRTPDSLGERDFTYMRSVCTTLRDPGTIAAEGQAHTEAVERDKKRRQQDEDEDFASYYQTMIRRAAEETGLDTATPEELASKLGGQPWMYDYNLTGE